MGAWHGGCSLESIVVSMPAGAAPYPFSPVRATDSMMRRRRMMNAISIGTVLSRGGAQQMARIASASSMAP